MVLFVAAIVLALGWGAGIVVFTRLAPGLAAMVPSTAISFILLGGALLAFDFNPSLIFVLRVISGIVFAIALSDLLVIATGSASGLDSLFLPRFVEQSQDAMAIATALSFLLAAVCTFILSLSSRIARRLFTPLATLGLLIPSVALVGYALDSAALYDVFAFTAMAVHTALLLALLFIALMLANPYGGWVWLLVGDEVGSRGARRLFPIVVLLPLVLCFLALVATRHGLFRADFRASLLALAMMTIGLTAVLRNARIENRSERKLTQTLASLEAALADKDLLLREVYHRVKNNLQQINALIAIEAAKFRDERVRSSFQAMSGRVQALGTVHQLLIQSPQPSDVNIATFLSQLGEKIAASHGLDQAKIALTVESMDEQIDLDASVTIGLLVNEVVANSIKHAFVGGDGGTIHIRYAADDDAATTRVLMVRDDGVGYRGQTDNQPPNAGFRIIGGLVKQLRGTMDIDNDNGTRVVVRFPAPTRE